MGQAQVTKQIREILHLWRTRKDDVEFVNKMQQLGWRMPSVFDSGCFKCVLMRGSLVVKFDEVAPAEHTLREWRIYRRSSPFKRGFLAKCYVYEDGLLVQAKLPRRCYKNEECKSARRWAYRFRILDWGTNHSHRRGRPVFFDFDNQGYGWDAWKLRRLTKSPRMAE